jgi:hypothetical protein
MKKLVLLVLVAACRRDADPSWAALPSGSAGDGTIAGPPAPVPRLSSPPAIDGKLDDAAWANATVLGPLVDPGQGGAVPADHPVAAFARVGWTESHLYLGLVVRDAGASSPFARGDVDPHIWAEASGIELMLQPGDPGDNRDYIEIQVDVAGAVWDTRFDDYNQPITGEGGARRYGRQDFDSRLERQVLVKDGSFYSVEMALPWGAIGGARAPVPPRPGDVWRMNLYSFRDGQRHALAWSPLRGQGNFHRASRFGKIRFD